MSSQSGLAVPPEVVDAFTAALSNTSTRALALTIPDTTSYALHATVPVGTKPHPSAPKGVAQYISDIATLLPTLPSAGTCASFLYLTDASTSDAEWILISYIPDSAPTSRPTAFDAHLKHREAPAPMTKSEEALRDIKQEEAKEAQERMEQMFGATSISTSSSPTPPPSTGPSRQASLQPHVFGAPQPIRQRSSDSASSSPIVTSPPSGGLARGGIGAMGAILGGASGLGAGADKGQLKWADGLADVLKGLLVPDAKGQVVILSIDAKSETIILHPSFSPDESTCTPETLASRLPSKEPSYAFYAWPTSGAGAASSPSGAKPAVPEKKDSLDVPQSVDPADVALPVTPTEAPAASVPSASSSSATPPAIAFIYACPPASPVRHRMLFSTCVRGLIRAADERCGIKVTKKIETSDIAELTKRYLETELFETPALTSLAPPSRNGSGASGGGGGVDTSSNSGDAWNAFGPRVGRPKPAGRR
ncbi:hypothetical protein QFC20_004192 [Naganishia adeliensis]|uniref:Uncharacterized protein n=1 Tax=Naganishia adeliensis TaxID=92952 RepID=A0ACC2W5J4_9TREE|nr:hypothetical protein QFC20_004192 [Naganishia adeliensis]